MICVERMRGSGFLPTISEYEPRCPSIVVEFCHPNSNQEDLSEDVPDCAPARNSNSKGVPTNIVPISEINNKLDSDKRDEKSNSIGSTKVRGLKECAEQICNQTQYRKASNGNQSDIRNKTISPSWDTLLTSVCKPSEIQDSQRDIRHTRINPNSSALPSISHAPNPSINTSDIRNTTIRAVSHSDSNTVRNLKPSLAIPRGMSSSSLAATDPWRAVVMVRIGDQVRIWAKDSKNLVVEAVENKLNNLESEVQKSVEHLVTIPDQINLDSLMATLSLEGQVIIKEIRQQKPSRGNITVIPIEKM